MNKVLYHLNNNNNNNNDNNNNNNNGFKPMCRIIIINVAAQDQAIKTKHYRNKILKIV